MEQEARLAAASISILPAKAEGFGEKFERFVRGYKKRPVAIEESFRGDPMVVLSNVRRGMSALRPKLPALRSDPTVNWDEMEAAEDVAEALVYACGFVVDDKNLFHWAITSLRDWAIELNCPIAQSLNHSYLSASIGRRLAAR